MRNKHIKLNLKDLIESEDELIELVKFSNNVFNKYLL